MTTIIDILLEDHEEIKTLLNEYPNDPEEIFAHLKRDLTLHTELEERVLYPNIQSFAAEDVQHAKGEHDKADQLIAELAKDTSNAGVFNSLKDAVTHHVEEEENELFPLTEEKLDDDRLAELGEEGARVKEEIKSRLS